jgi:outer membrane murein-binding lipoprotein Lpp
MATIGLVNLTEPLLNQAAGQTQKPQAATPSNATSVSGATAATGDTFTLSAQNTAQAAGLFTVSRSSLLSPAAEALLAPAVAAALATPATATAPTANAATTVTATPTPTVANNEKQLQALNIALEALGLSSEDISKIDSIASVINDFNPAAFAVLANQLKAQQVALQAGASTAAPAQTRAATA